MDRLFAFNCIGVVILLIVCVTLLLRLNIPKEYKRPKILVAAGLLLMALDYLLFNSGLSSEIMLRVDDMSLINVMMLIMYAFLAFAGTSLIVSGLWLAGKIKPNNTP